MTLALTQEMLNTAWALKHGAEIQGFDEITGWNPDKPPKGYQFRGIGYLYYMPKSLLLDGVGVGKSIEGLGLIQLLRARGEMKRALILCPGSNVYGTWEEDAFRKFIADLPYAVAATGMTKAKRRKVYADDSWEVLLSNHETFWRDLPELMSLEFDVVVFDEADVLRKKSNQAYKAMKKLAAKANRVVLMTATPINNKLADLHSLLVLIGIDHLVGDAKAFQRRYVDVVFDEVPTPRGKPKKFVPRVVGHKNLDELKAIIGPYYLRRTHRDIPDSDIPDLSSQERWLALSPDQENLYRRIQNAVTDEDLRNRISKEAVFLRLRQCCTSTALIDPALGDHSVKMDWLIEQATNDWQEEKVVLFSNWRDALALFARRLDAAGIGHVTMTSDVKPVVREEYRQRFINDPDCRFVLGTTAIEKGLNLQVARIQVNLDMLFNPQRHEQLAGRVARSGSVHDQAFVFSLFTSNTVDEGTVKILAKKAALSNFMWDDASELMSGLAATLSDAELTQLILGRPVNP